MGEIIYKLFFFMMLVIIISFGMFIKIQLNKEKLFHGLDFVGINSDFVILTWVISYQHKGIIYVATYPIECSWNNKWTLRCLKALKAEWGVYNWLVFKKGLINNLK